MEQGNDGDGGIVRGSLLDLMAAAIAVRPRLVTSYRNDFETYDRRVINEHGLEGDELVWIIRECGTAILRYGFGIDPVVITYWLGPDQDHACFHLGIDRVVSGVRVGWLKPISDVHAAALASVHIGARDLTDYARSIGYRGRKPVYVRDGLVVNHRLVRWDEFCDVLRAGRYTA